MSRRRYRNNRNNAPFIEVVVARPRPQVSLGMVLLHTLLTLITGGTWLVVLVIWYVLRR